MVIQILSLCVAFLAIIIGPIVSYKIAKKNLEFQFRAMTQGIWIDKLEEAAFEFLKSNVDWVEKYDGLIMRNRQHSMSLNEINQKIDDMLDSINSSLVKLDMLLDEKAALQKDTIDNCTEMKGLILQIKKEEDKEIVLARLRELHRNIVKNLKEIFKQEREKIALVFK